MRPPSGIIYAVGYGLGRWGTSYCKQLQVSYYLILHLEVGLLDRSKSPLLGTPMQKRRCLQPSKSAMQPCRPWSTNINRVSPGISELKSLCKRQMFHIEVRAILRASDLLGLLANTVDLSNLLQKARSIKLTLFYCCTRFVSICLCNLLPCLLMTFQLHNRPSMKSQEVVVSKGKG